MNKIEIENKLNELKLKNCTAFWIITKNGYHQGGYMNEIINNVKINCIQLKRDKVYYSIPYSEIKNIMYIY